MSPRAFSRRVLSRPALEVAPRLLGARLVRQTPEGLSSGIIVETEAYNQDDPASHTFGGRTQRNQHMFGPGGLAYVYFTYGMHHCVNVVTGPAGRGEAVLIRALEPVRGLALMASRRDVELPPGGERALRRGARHEKRFQRALWNLTAGPARLTRALQIDAELDGADLLAEESPLRLFAPRAYASSRGIVRATRIGIRKAVDRRWRFYLRDNPFVSVS